MLGRKMAGGSMLRLMQGMSNLNISSMPWNISQRFMGGSSINKKLKSLVDKPKRPGNAYFQFKMVVEPEFKRKNPNLSLPERALAISKMWKDASEETKNMYKDMAQKNFQKYKEELNRIGKSLSPQQKAEIQELESELKKYRSKKESRLEKRKKLLQFDKPKRPLNPFLLFLHSLNKPRMDDVARRKFLSEAGATWAKMSENQRKPYVEEYEKGIVEYHKKLEAWEQKMISLGNSDLVRMKTLKEKICS